jgi:N-acetylmuramoyl-L-alanine amidase
LGIVKQVGEWYGVLMIDGSTGWISRAVVAMLDYDLVIAGQQGQTSGQRIVQAASKYVGVPYTWGGYSWGGLDCSGFVKAVYANFGVDLPRCSRDQARVGQSISYDQLQPGDRLYFACKGGDIDHAGIYAGNGYFIHSASSRGGVTFDTLSGSRYGRSLVVARR